MQIKAKKDSDMQDEDEEDGDKVRSRIR